jgi:hypothetical protein
MKKTWQMQFTARAILLWTGKEQAGLTGTPGLIMKQTIPSSIEGH